MGARMDSRPRLAALGTDARGRLALSHLWQQPAGQAFRGPQGTFSAAAGLGNALVRTPLSVGSTIDQSAINHILRNKSPGL